MSSKEALDQAYRVLAPYSDKQRWEFYNNLVHLEFLTRHLPTEGKILDAGCYIGVLALALRFLGYDVVGADKYLFGTSEANQYSVQAKERLERIWQEHGLRVIEADLTESDVGTFAAVISIAVIEHQPYPRFFLEGLKRALAPGGTLYIATPNVTNGFNRLRILFGKAPMANVEAFYTDADKFNGHWREYTKRELAVMVQRAGFEIVEAASVQSMRPNWKRPHEGVMRLVARIAPLLGDTALVVARRRD